MQKDLLCYGQQEGHEWQMYVVNDVPLSAQSSWQPTSVVTLYPLIVLQSRKRWYKRGLMGYKSSFTQHIFQKKHEWRDCLRLMQQNGSGLLFVLVKCHLTSLFLKLIDEKDVVDYVYWF